MPHIYDNIDADLLPALKGELAKAERADFCVGYFNLRGWRQMDDQIERFKGTEQSRVRLLVGMRQSPEDELRAALRLAPDGGGMDNSTALRLKKRAAEEFRQQLMIGAPTDADEKGLLRLLQQLRDGKLVVKLHLRYQLHAKLYLLYRAHDPSYPRVGIVGSSNLTFAGLSAQGELNVDVPDSDATAKLATWFDARWQDQWSLDITKELIEILVTGWPRKQPLPPYYIYLKMAYHLSQEARAGLSEFHIPAGFGAQLFEFQKAAVQIAAHHVNQRGGVLIGDVVGLGKTLMATALARILQDDFGWETLILCPKNLVEMWRDYVNRYHLVAHVMSTSQAQRDLAQDGPFGLRRYRVVLIDESHNLRNREGARYRAIKEYIAQNNSRCILLSATPYNKTFLDLSAQLRLFVPEDLDLGIRPERLIGATPLGEVGFRSKYQCGERTLVAFEKSEYADDWRELMRLYMVRRTRGFIQANYAEVDAASGRRYLTMPNGERSYFPTRVPRTVKFRVDDANPRDPYAALYSPAVVEVINSLSLPRYGLGNYIAPRPTPPPTAAENKQLDGLNRAGKRLMGFCRTNLFKRLESGGPAFIQSVERHTLRNFVFLHAIEHGLPLPLGTQDAELLDPEIFDPAAYDEDTEATLPGMNMDENDDTELEPVPTARGEAEYRQQAAAVYMQYAGPMRRRFKWLRPSLLAGDLQAHLLADARALLGVLARCGEWRPADDAKLNALYDLLTVRHAGQKVLIFTQFADTVRYLEAQLVARGVTGLAGVTGESENPTALAWRFSPVSNGRPAAPGQELRALVGTDVLSEGQNLQDCAIIVNYDLPWAIIRLIQRAGRVDRIGQQGQEILCYSFLPADGVERIIRLRKRVRQRLRENAEVVGTDEAFFEDEDKTEPVLDIYNERAGIYDGDDDSEVDLASQAYQIWKNATDADPSLLKTIPALPNVIYSTRAHDATPLAPAGALLYVRTADGADALAWVDERGNPVTQSQLAILRAAACDRDTPGLERRSGHHELVQRAAEAIASQDHQPMGGQLGRASGARYRVYERLKSYAERVKGTLWDSEELPRAIEDIYRYPLRESANETLNRQLRIGVADDALARLVVALRDDEKLCVIPSDGDDPVAREPQIICSLGLVARS